MKTGMRIGAAIGGVVFALLGIMPGFYFGGYGALSLIQKLVNGPVEPTLLIRAGIVFGMVIGIACAATVCLVIGSLMGSAIGYMVSAPFVHENQLA